VGLGICSEEGSKAWGERFVVAVGKQVVMFEVVICRRVNDVVEWSSLGRQFGFCFR